MCVSSANCLVQWCKLTQLHFCYPLGASALWLRDQDAPASPCTLWVKAEGSLVTYVFLLRTLLFGNENVQRWDEDIIYTQFLKFICVFTCTPECSLYLKTNKEDFISKADLGSAITSV